MYNVHVHIGLLYSEVLNDVVLKSFEFKTCAKQFPRGGYYKYLWSCNKRYMHRQFKRKPTIASSIATCTHIKWARIGHELAVNKV